MDAASSSWPVRSGGACWPRPAVRAAGSVGEPGARGGGSDATGTSKRTKAGFTLVEMTISMALMSLILISAYLCLNAGFAAQRLVDPRLEAVQSARVALNLITADLRSACPLAKNMEFIGMDRMLGEVEADNLDFATHHYTPSRPGDGDYCQTSYFLEPDHESGELVLWRRRNPRIGLDPFSGGSREEIARGVHQLKFEYYDGFVWYDTWGDPDGRASARDSLLLDPNLSGLPEAVRVTLALGTGRDSRSGTPEASVQSVPPGADAERRANAGEPPLVFRTVARINRIAIPPAGGDGGEGAAGSTAPGTPSGARPGGMPAPGAGG